ncbi:nitroreductase family protein [Acidicapsa ligni]|uniref:nitroreductase family protein n=1 Tax=Acidicapsa ligni TaxID=542300 RepID=UPI0021DFB4B8|nr:nitroreductase family protein [Acidicapsa ligni]
MSLSIEEVNKLKKIPVEGLLPALAQRWSPRSFQTKAVSDNDLKIILEAARWAPSSSNEQPWRFLVGIKGSETHTKIFETLVGFNQGWAGKPHILILGFALQKDSKGNPNRYALYDLGQAASDLVDQASALGLATHSMGGFDHEAIRRAFNLTDDYALGAVIAVGYQDEPSALSNEQMQQREIAPRERKPLSHIALTALDTPFEF